MPWFDPEDLSRGMEPIPIQVLDLSVYMMPFQYMSSSRVHDEASLNLSLFSPKLGKCCDCGTRDCLTTNTACDCAKACGGEIAYEQGGILKDRFLRQDIYNSSSSKRTKDSLYRKRRSCTFIRECSVRCRCHNKCGNRVVQQGMMYAVEIFHTGNIGWGVRASRSIPKGAFVFELVGEILTNAELIVRN